MSSVPYVNMRYLVWHMTEVRLLGHDDVVLGWFRTGCKQKKHVRTDPIAVSRIKPRSSSHGTLLRDAYEV